jgi:hypothetical protein
MHILQPIIPGPWHMRVADFLRPAGFEQILTSYRVLASNLELPRMSFRLVRVDPTPNFDGAECFAPRSCSATNDVVEVV